MSKQIKSISFSHRRHNSVKIFFHSIFPKNHLSLTFVTDFITTFATEKKYKTTTVTLNI